MAQELSVRDVEAGGSNPLTPTRIFFANPDFHAFWFAMRIAEVEKQRQLSPLQTPHELPPITTSDGQQFHFHPVCVVYLRSLTPERAGDRLIKTPCS